MIVSADKNMRFYNSTDLKHWEYRASWAKATAYSPTSSNAPTSTLR